MPTTADTISPIMGRKKKTDKESTKYESKSHTTINVSARLPEDLVAAMDRMINDLRPKPTTKALLEDALETYLEAKGYWPPPEHKEDET